MPARKQKKSIKSKPKETADENLRKRNRSKPPAHVVDAEVIHLGQSALWIADDRSPRFYVYSYEVPSPLRENQTGHS